MSDKNIIFDIEKEIDDRTITFDEGHEALVIFEFEEDGIEFMFVFSDGEIIPFELANDQYYPLTDELIRDGLMEIFYAYMHDDKSNEMLVRAIYDYFDYHFMYEKEYEAFVEKQKKDKQ